MEEKTLKKDFTVFCGISETSYSFSLVLHYRQGEEIKCYSEDEDRSVYAYTDLHWKKTNIRPEENIEIEILNYQELRDRYLVIRGFTMGMPQVEPRFRRDMHIFPCGERYYVRYAAPMKDSMDKAKFIAEFWAMYFVYLLLGGIERKALDPGNICKQKLLFDELKDSGQFAIKPSELVNQ